MDQSFPRGECPPDRPRTELQRRIDRGEQPRAILEELCRNTQARLYRYGCQRLGDVHEAYDFVQTVFMKMHVNFDTMITREPVDAWIFAVAHNEVVNWYRKKAKLDLPADAEILDRDAAGELRANSFEEEVETWVGSAQPIVIYMRTIAAAGWLQDRDIRAYWLTTVEGMRQREVAAWVGLSQGRISQLQQKVERQVRTALYLCEILGLVTAPPREALIRSHLELLDQAARLMPADRELLRRAGAAVRRDALAQPVLHPKDAEAAIKDKQDGPVPTLHDLHDAEGKYADAIGNPTPRCIESPCAVHTASRR